MTPFAALLGGSAGGFGGSLAAHVIVTLADRLGNSSGWLKGPYGPPFFNVSLFMGIMYGGIALGLSKRLGVSLLGLFGPFLGIALPMTVLTRTARWGWGDEGAVSSGAWYYAVIVVFVLAVWGTIFALGWRLGGERKWLGGIAAMAGAFGGYLLLSGLLRFAPGISGWFWAPGLLPQPTVLLDGLMTGCGMGMGLWLCHRRDHEKANGA